MAAPRVFGGGLRRGCILPPVDQVAVGSPEEFRRIMLLVVVTGTLAFGVSGTMLWLFFRSLQREGRDGDLRFTRRSGLLLAGVLGSLLFFSLVFAALAYWRV
jgi:hypothetical protein